MSPERAAQRPLELIHANLSGQRLRSLKYVAPRIGIITEARMITAEYSGDEMTALAQMLINGVTDNKNADVRAGATHLLRAVDFAKVDIHRIGKVYSLAINRLLQHPEATTDLAKATLHLAPHLAQASHLADEAKEKWMALSRETSSASRSRADGNITALPILLLSSVQINPHLARTLRNIVILAKEQRRTKTQIATQLGLPMKDVEDYVSALVDTAGLDLSPEQEKPINEQELSRLLAAVGNHEGKGLLLSLMVKDQLYSATAAAHLLQEQRSILSLKEVTELCKSLPIGSLATVVRQAGDRYDSYSKTAEGEMIGDALAGHLLVFSLDHPELSLSQVFGSSPLTRFRIITELINGGNEPQTKGGLASVLSTRYHLDFQNISSLELHLKTFARNGLITYNSVTSNETFVTHKVTGNLAQDEIPLPSNDKTFAQLVYGVVREQSEAGLTTQGIYQILSEKYPQYAEKPQASVVARIKVALSNLRKLELVRSEGREGFSESAKSSITLTEQQMSTLVALRDIINNFITGDETFLEEGRRKAHTIANSDARFLLLQKATDASPQHQGEGDRRSAILALLNGNSGLSAKDVYERLGASGSQNAVKVMLERLKKAGQVTVEKKKGVSYYSISPTVDAEEVVFDD